MNWDLKGQLTTAIALFAVILVATAGWGAYSKRATMLEDRIGQMRNVVQIAEKALLRQQASVASGKKTVVEAKQSASDELSAMRFGENGYVGVLTSSNVFVVHPDLKLVGQNMDAFRDPDGVAVFKDMVTSARANHSVIISYRFKKPSEDEATPKITFAQYDPQWQWTIFSGLYVDDIDHVFYESLTWDALIFGALTIGLMAAARVFLTIKIIRPITVAVETCERIASGNLAVSVVATSRGEIGRLLMALQRMQAQLATTVNAVRTTSSTIVSAAHEAAGDSTHLSERSEQQAAALEQTAATMEQLTSTVKQNAETRDKLPKLRSRRLIPQDTVARLWAESLERC